MPPPIPLSGAGAAYSAGSQVASPSSSEKAGLIASHAASGEEASASVPSTAAINARTTGVSRTNSALTVLVVSDVFRTRDGRNSTPRSLAQRRTKEDVMSLDQVI